MRGKLIVGCTCEEGNYPCSRCTQQMKEEADKIRRECLHSRTEAAQVERKALLHTNPHHKHENCLESLSERYRLYDAACDTVEAHKHTVERVRRFTNACPYSLPSVVEWLKYNG